MRIGFVVEPYEETQASGMGYVVLEFIKNILEQGEGHQFVLYSSTHIKKQCIPGHYKNVMVPKNFVRKFFWFLLLKDDIDVLIFVTPLLPLVVPARIKTILICQELYTKEISAKSLFGRVYEFVRDSILMPISLMRATKIVIPSQATKNDLLHFYNISEKKITIIHDGFQDISKFKNDVLGSAQISEPYFFFAGRVKLRKNVHAIVSGFIDFKLRTKASCKLIIAGGYGGDYYRRMVEALQKAGLSEDVVFVGYVTGPELYSYYKNTLALVYPSLHEGFGMPLVEAMSIGTPIITSNISSMPEVVGDAGLLVNPHDAIDISSAMERIYYDQALRTGLGQKGIRRSKMFSWEKSAQELLVLLETL